MALFLATLAAAILAYLVYLVFAYYRHVAKLPRGPAPLPFIGNLLSMDRVAFHKYLERVAAEYGSIFTVYVPIPIVVLAKYEAVKYAFINKGDDFSGRPWHFLDGEFVFCPNGGVINSNGDSWKENRRAAIGILRDFGMGKGLMEEQVKESLNEMLRFLDNIEDKSAVDMRWPIQLYVANVINETLFGYRYTYDDCEPLVDYVETFNKLIAEFSASPLSFLIYTWPWMKRLPIIGWYALGRYAADNRKLMDYVEKNVARALAEEDDTAAEPTCFVRAYARRIGSSPNLNLNQLKATSADFFLAGAESTTTTLRWAVLFLADNQEAQEKIRAEVLSVVGTSRLPSMSDKPSLPYTSAAILEIQRRANVFMTNTLRRTTVDTEVMGVKIPKDTLVNGDIHMIMDNDPNFENADQFRPERYLHEDGKTLRKELIERTIPFSIGKRQCAGEGMARVELFLGVAGLLQRFRIQPADSNPHIDLEPIASNFMLPKPQRVRIEAV